MQTRHVDIDPDVDRLLIVSDLHAFTEPLAAIDDRLASMPGRTQIIANGDYAMGGTEPAEVLEWVERHAGKLATLGNHDELTLTGATGHHPPYTEAGAYLLMNDHQRRYLANLPHVIEPTWRNHRLRIIHGHRTLDGGSSSWRATPQQLIDRFADPDVELTALGHTHFPFVRADRETTVANSGSTALLLLGLRQKNGEILYHGDPDQPFTPVDQIYSTFLSVTIENDTLTPTVEKFDYDRNHAADTLTAADDPDTEGKTAWIKTAVYGP